MLEADAELLYDLLRYRRDGLPLWTSRYSTNVIALMQMSNFLVSFVLCLALFFGIASEASAECPASPPCGRYCDPVKRNNTCKPKIAEPKPAETSNSTSSDPLPPSSVAVAPSIGNPVP